MIMSTFKVATLELPKVLGKAARSVARTDLTLFDVSLEVTEEEILVGAGK